EALGWRTATLQSVQQLLVAGNVCEHMLPDGRIRVFRLDQYVTNRDYRGKVVEGIIEENLAENTTPEDISREGSEQDE
ncbi:MAG: hypothetical protein GWN58_53800, partial [Anaerolineae bacterium]|nr:hypothetical protein [Anaerolineae bacterium]